MAGLRFDYSMIEKLIGSFGNVHEHFMRNGYLVPSPDSDDGVAFFHVDTVQGQEDVLVINAVASFDGAREGAQDAYDVFKAADGAEV